MNYKNLKKKLELSESMVASAVWEIQFANLQKEHLLSTLQELEVMTSDKLSKWVISNAIDRYNLDLMIHTRKLFD